MTLTVGSLFSGIGGLLDLGLERAGHRVVWQCEVDPYCCRVLAKHWPNVPNLGDVTTVDWSGVERVDVICGGYPCQPFSLAGQRQGTNDPRHLWPYMLDAIRHLRPRWALLENVPGHLSLGFGRVLGDLAEIGFDAEWDCVPAAAVGAPHIRDRVFIVAYPHGEQLQHEHGDRRQASAVVGDDGTPQPVADTESIRPSVGNARAVPGLDERERPTVEPERRGGPVSDADRSGRAEPEGVEAEPGRWPAPRRSDWWEVEPDVGRVVDGVPSRVDRVRALGNAVVPQVAEFVGWLLTGVAA